MTLRIATVGHSTRSLDAFIDILRSHGVEQVVDVRRYPGSRRHPHFERTRLAEALQSQGIDYHWFEGLGGRRSRAKDSPHTAWQVPAFAGYADHMDTAPFRDDFARLLALAGERFTTVMCAEARPEQCHRRLISDMLVSRGVEVLHLMTASRAVPHRLPAFARVEGDRVIYDAGQPPLLSP